MMTSAHYRTRFLQALLLPCALCAWLAAPCRADIPVQSETTATKHFLVAAHEWPPFSSRDSKYFGLAPRIVAQVLQAQGVNVEFRFVDWRAGLNGIVSEKYDGALVWMATDIHHESFLVSDPILEFRTALYFRRNMPAPASINDLLGYRMGYSPNYVYDQESYQMIKARGIETVRGDSDLMLFQMLLDGKIDFFLTPQMSATNLLDNNLSQEQQNALTSTTNLFKFPPVKLVVNRHRAGSAELIDKFNAGLQRLKTDGTLDRYIDDIRFSKY